MFKVSEFAERAGVTVRTLHHYDRLGLLKPSGRTEAGYRLYADQDFARLQQIVTLKFIGLPLKDIKALIDRNKLGIAGTLRLQRELLSGKLRQVEAAIHAIDAAERSMVSNGEPDWTALKKIIEVLDMQANNDKTWMKQYYSDDAQAKIAELGKRWTPEMQIKVQQDWKDLISEVETAISDGVEPVNARAQALAQRWSELVKSFTGGDPEIQKGVNSLYADQSNWPSTFQKPFSDQVWEYIKKAMAANGTNRG